MEDLLSPLASVLDLASKYPIAEKISLLVITLLFASGQLKKRFKSIEDGVVTMAKSITDLNDSLKDHIIQTDRRMTDGDQRFGKVENEIKAIKAHVGMK